MTSRVSSGALFGALMFAIGFWSWPANASSVLFNQGPSAIDPYNVVGSTINNGFRVTDDFVLASPSTVTGVAFPAWSFAGALQSVDWAITTLALGGTTLASGTATSFTTVLTANPNGQGFNVFTETFSISSLPLAAGTYWLQLSNAIESGTRFVFWDAAFIPAGNAVNNSAGDLATTMTFQILGSDAATTPLPATLPLFATGLGALGLLGWRRKKKAAALAA